MSTTTTPCSPFLATALTKRFGAHTALDDISLELRPGRIIGLLGRNGAGKSTLLNLATGLILPTSGECRTLGVATARLDTPQLSRLGIVQQEAKLLEWMTVRGHLDFNASFHERWDRALERRLLTELELDEKRVVMQLSPGDRQKLCILLGVCHHPSLLLLDEPMSALDPIARTRMVEFILGLLRDDECTVLISSHILTDVEKLIDWVVCLHKGRLVENCAFDELQESFSEWTLTSAGGTLPDRFNEPFVLAQQGHERLARLRVRTRDEALAGQLASRHGAELATRPLSLDEIFPFITDGKEN